MGITTTRKLLTRSRMADADALEIGLKRLTSRRPLTNDCRVALFEVAGDDSLHVNVTHGYGTQAVRGWAGPAILPQGFVHNRRFEDMPPDEIVRHVGEMIFAVRI